MYNKAPLYWDNYIQTDKFCNWYNCKENKLIKNIQKNNIVIHTEGRKYKTEDDSNVESSHVK